MLHRKLTSVRATPTHVLHYVLHTQKPFLVFFSIGEHPFVIQGGERLHQKNLFYITKVVFCSDSITWKKPKHKCK